MLAKTIIIGIDFGEPSLIAARWIARTLGESADLVLAHAVHVPEIPQFLRDLYADRDVLVANACSDAESKLRAFCDSLNAPRVRAEVHVGRPEDVLATAVGTSETSMLVVGPRRQDAGIRHLLGNIAERALRRSRASVLLARGLPEAAPKDILVGLDETPLLPEVLQAAARLAGARSRVTAMYVASPLSYLEAPTAKSTAEHRSREDRVRARVNEWANAQLSRAGLAGARLTVAFGDPGTELLEATRALHRCLLVVGRNGGDSPGERFFGRATELVLAEGDGPVLVVSGPS